MAQETKPVIARNQSVWLGEKRFRSGNGDRTHLIDAGAKEAPGPVETLLGAIATCSAVDVVDIMEKRRTPLESLEVHVEGERRPEPPRRLVAVRLEFRLGGAGVEPDQAQRAVQLSFEKYCSVAGSLASDIRVEATIVVNGEKLPALPLTIWTPSAQS
jgi:putative redox protein